MVKKLLLLLTPFLLLITQLFWVIPAHAAGAPTVLFSEVKLGGAVSGQPTEFIELYNNTDNPINFDNGDWWLEYAKPAAFILNCSITSWQSMDSSSNVKQQKVAGSIAARGYMTIPFSLNDAAGGSLRLQHNGLIDDLVGWGSATSAAPCVQGVAATIPPNGKSIQRQAFSGNNAADFTEPRDPTPLAAAATSTPVPDHTPTPTCQGISITEIVPNPAGSDTGAEFVELLNETNMAVSTAGCTLKVGGAAQVMPASLSPGYTALFTIALPNAAGGQVVLVTTTTTQTVTYPADLADDESYSLIDGAWQQGALPTPGQPNAMPAVVVSEAVTSEETVAPCAAGKYRNPETNRCRSIETGSGPVACQAGQVRNPETNRCRNAVTAAANTTACASGQSRNPETNRCKKDTVATATTSACKPGQARNPETNRCRKVLAAKSSTSPGDSSSSKKPVSYAVIGIVAAIGVAYGLWEYRGQLRDLLLRRRQKA